MTQDDVRLVTLAECPPGPFLFEGRCLGFKTEYGMMLPVPGEDAGRWEVTSHPDAYVIASGECFWGGAKDHAERSTLLVKPIDADDLAFAPRQGDREANIVEQARRVIVRVLNEAAARQEHSDSRTYLQSMANNVASSEAAMIDSYLVLDCVIAALSPTSQTGEG